MSECIHRPLCTNECPCDYLVEQKETEYTALVPDFKGSQIVYAYCAVCRQPVMYPTERPYNFCPYCSKRVIYKKEET